MPKNETADSIALSGVFFLITVGFIGYHNGAWVLWASIPTVLAWIWLMQQLRQ